MGGGSNLSKPILYKANETDFTTLGLGVLVDELGTFAIEERNGQFYLEMEYPIDGKHFNELKNDRLIKVDASNNLKNQRFKIIRITKPAKGKVKVYAEHVSNLSADKQLNPNVSYSGNAQSALNTWGNNITDTHPFTFHSDIPTTGSGRWEVDEVENARRALGGVQGSILDTYGGEYRFDNYHISLLRQRGDDNGIPIMYGKNLIDLEQEEEIASTYTSIYPYALHHPEGSDEAEIITLPELVIDSEHVDKYAHRKILKVNFTADEIETVSELRTRTQRYITENNVGIPKINLRVKFVDLAKTLDYKDTALVEEINLCDWVTVYFDKLDIRQRAKVIKTVWNVGLDRYEEIEIGETRASLSQSINSVVDGRLEHVEEQINVIRTAANGKNKNHWGPNEPLPQDSKEGDTWFKSIGDGEEEIYRYNGYMWVFVLSTADTTLNKEAIEQAQLDIEQAQATADEAVEQINTAVANAGFTSLDETISSVQAISNQAQINAGTAIDNALEAMQQASLAVDNTGSLNIRVDEVENTLSVKADKQTVDDLTSVVDSQALDIQANAQGLALKANQDTVDTLAGTVQSLGTEFDIVAGQVNSRVWNTDIETAIDGIEVGGRNLAEYDNWIVTRGETVGDYSFILTSDSNGVRTDIRQTAQSLKLEPSKNYTFSFKIRKLSGNLLKIGGHTQPNFENGSPTYVDGIKISEIFSSRNNLYEPLDDGEWHQVVVNLKSVASISEAGLLYIQPNRITYEAVSVEIKDVMFEKGNKATDWAPAPEDTDAKIDYIETEWTQTFDEFSQNVSHIDGRVTAQKQTIDGITQTVTDQTGKIASQQLTIDGLQTEVYDPETGLTSVNTQLANLVNIAVTGDELSGALSVLEDNLNLRLVAKDEVIAQINLSNENILIQSNRILLDGDVTVSGTAWLPGAVIADASIDTAQIADLAVSSAKIVSLDVSKLSGHTTEFVQSTWNNITTSVQIDNYGINVYGQQSWRRNYMNETGFEFFGSGASTSGYKAGAIGRFLGSGTPLSRMNVMHNSLGRFSLGIGVNSDYDLTLGTSQGSSDRFNPSLNIRGETGRIEVYKPLMVESNSGQGIRLIEETRRTYYGTSIVHVAHQFSRIHLASNRVFVESPGGISFYTDQGTLSFVANYQGLHMQNRKILNVQDVEYSSDANLKENITSRNEDDLTTIMSIEYKNYDFISGGKNKRGFIAQELQLIDSDLITVSENGTLGYDGQGYVHTIGHAVQQLALREENTNQIASQALQLGESNKEKIKRLEKRIEELESAA